MRILFDQGTPAPLRRHLADHVVSTAYEMGWSRFSNGDLLGLAETHFNAFVTTDHGLRYQQNLARRKLAILILPFANWPKLMGRIEEVVTAVNGLKPGDYLEL